MLACFTTQKRIGLYYLFRSGSAGLGIQVRECWSVWNEGSRLEDAEWRPPLENGGLDSGMGSSRTEAPEWEAYGDMLSDELPTLRRQYLYI